MSAKPDSVVPLDRSTRLYGRKITAAWQKSVEGILEAGGLLLQAKAELPHGEFERMVSESCPFRMRTAQTLMKIAEHPVLSNAQHVAYLPNSWGTLGELSRFEPKELSHALRNYWVKPEMTREQVVTLRARVQKALGLRSRMPRQPSRPKAFSLYLREAVADDVLAWLSEANPRTAAVIAERVARFLESLREEMADG